MPRRHLSQLGIAGSMPPPALEAPAGEHGYPRPMLHRAQWISLNGPWDFAIDAEALWDLPSEVSWGPTPIRVPFAPETQASDIGDQGLYASVWYRRRVAVPPLDHQRLVVHFGAVDYEATVWVNGKLAGGHVGGYTPFSFDVTNLVEGAVELELVVRAVDDPNDLDKPRGKQDWQLLPHSIWYPRTTGIWQTVWMETVPCTRIECIDWTPNLERWEIGLGVIVVGAARRRRHRLGVRLRCGDVLLADDEYLVVAGEVRRRIALSDPGIDDFRNELLWSPGVPKLIDAELRLLDETGAVIDEVRSYTALRSFTVQRDRLVLNGRPYPLRMVLDQGYWDKTGLTPPHDQALRRDVELTKAMGFNGVRKHQKIEDPRYLYWADRLGLLVWEEMPSAYRFTQRSVERLTHEWIEAVRRDKSNPCIIAWVPFNESWGVPNLPDSMRERHYVEGLYHLTKTLDPTRPVIGNDGWESVATDIIGIHDYDESPDRIAARYGAHEVVPRLLTRERPGGRVLVIDGGGPAGKPEQPLVLSEFGGIALTPPPASSTTWGYTRCHTSEELSSRFTALLAVVRSLELLSGYCYTQFADTYQEANGLLYADRRPKLPLEEIAAATRGRLDASVAQAPDPATAPAEERDPHTPTTERDGAPT
jgi:hypothetical protein